MAYGERVLTVLGNKATRPLDNVRAKGIGAAYLATDVGVKTLATPSTIARKVIIVLTVTTTFAANGGAAPTVKIGETDTDDKFAAAAVVVNTSTAGTVYVFAGELSAGKALIATLTAATGAGAGAYSLTAILASAI